MPFRAMRNGFFIFPSCFVARQPVQLPVSTLASSRSSRVQEADAAGSLSNGALTDRSPALHLTRIFGGVGQWRIPKGFRLKVQGCEARATVGNSRVGTSTPKELCCIKRAGLGRGEQRRNTVGVDGVLRMRTRGSSCLAGLPNVGLAADAIPLGLEMRVRCSP
jgi:hypothetical protein